MGQVPSLRGGNSETFDRPLLTCPRRFTRIGANPKGNQAIVRHLGVARSHAVLNRDGAGELDEQAVTHQLHYASVVFGNRWVDQFVGWAFNALSVPVSSTPMSRL